MKTEDITLEKITPLTARKWLVDHNTNNRRLRMWWAQAMAAAMARGEWITTHQGVAFTESGRLVDGQHRLEAICQYGSPVEMFVFRGVPDNAFKVIDVGVKRKTEDLTGLPKKTAEACRFMSTLIHGGNVTAQTTLDVADAGAAELHERLMSHCSKTKAVYTTAPIRAAAIALVLDGYSETEVFTTYGNLVFQKFDELPPIAYSFIRQVNDKKLGIRNHLDVLARALKVLNPNNKNLTRVNVSQADGSAASEYVRTILLRTMRTNKG